MADRAYRKNFVELSKEANPRSKDIVDQFRHHVERNLNISAHVVGKLVWRSDFDNQQLETLLQMAETGYKNQTKLPDGRPDQYVQFTLFLHDFRRRKKEGLEVVYSPAD